jgi:hypothetical protein
MYRTAGLLPDTTYKYLAFDHMGRHFAVVIDSPENAPSIVARNVDRRREASEALGRLGGVILKPMQSGTVDGRSYAIYPYCQPLYESRAAWALQRLWLRPAMLTWLRAATEVTRDRPSSQELEWAFADPLQHIVSMEQMPQALRDGARVARSRLESGAWKPYVCLMHGDLWKGNVLLAPGSYRWDRFSLIDWGGSLVRGYAMFDLIRLSLSFKLGGKGLKREIQDHCRTLECELTDSRSYLLTALGHLGLNLEHFPINRYVQMSSTCWNHLNSAGGNSFD